MFDRIAKAATLWAGSPVAVIGSVVIVIVWAVTGPIFGFSDTWQLVINTGTTILTFNMVFLIQSTQNRDGVAIQTKLDDLLRSQQGADNRLIAIEEDERETLESAQERGREAKT